MRRRKVEVFSLSFLDCICCGFGAVVLFYTIVAGQAGVKRVDRTNVLQAEVNRLEEEVLVGSRNLVVMRVDAARIGFHRRCFCGGHRAHDVSHSLNRILMKPASIGELRAFLVWMATRFRRTQ